MITDDRFDSHFAQLRQVFAYVTDQCNLRCVQCYYKPWLKREAAEIDFDVLVALLGKFRTLGATKLSLLGGEPTLYGRGRSGPRLRDLVVAARGFGYEYIRIVTSGVSGGALSRHVPVDLLDEITVSIDGDTAEIHDALRGPGAFRHAVACLDVARHAQLPIQITICVHRGNIGHDGLGRPLLDRAIEWSIAHGAGLVNLHPIIKMGAARDSWTGLVDISPSEWLDVYHRLRTSIDAGAYPIPVRVPIRFASAAQFASHPDFFGFCPVKLAERVEIHPNGQVHSCALNNGTPIAMARFHRVDEGLALSWADEGNELNSYPFDLRTPHPCPVMKGDFGDLLPLCVSLKPAQVSLASPRTRAQ